MGRGAEYCASLVQCGTKSSGWHRQVQSYPVLMACAVSAAAATCVRIGAAATMTQTTLCVINCMYDTHCCCCVVLGMTHLSALQGAQHQGPAGVLPAALLSRHASLSRSPQHSDATPAAERCLRHLLLHLLLLLLLLAVSNSCHRAAAPATAVTTEIAGALALFCAACCVIQITGWKIYCTIASLKLCLAAVILLDISNLLGCIESARQSCLLCGAD